MKPRYSSLMISVKPYQPLSSKFPEELTWAPGVPVESTYRGVRDSPDSSKNENVHRVAHELPLIAPIVVRSLRSWLSSRRIDARLLFRVA